MMDAIPWPIVDTPNSHGMFMLGTSTLYLSHMPMFTKQDHYYQLTLQARLDKASMQTYLADKAAHPDQVYNLINLDSDLFTLPALVSGGVKSYTAVIYRGYSNSGGGTPGTQIVAKATVTPVRVIYFRAFDQNTPRPQRLTYMLFGDGKEAHLDHYIAADPDYQQLATLAKVPAWLSPAQLQAGVAVTFAQPVTPVGCVSPLPSGDTPVSFQGIASAPATLRLGASYWYSTGNMLNAQDPCDNSGVAPHAGHK
jgi:hypothetical protein